MRIAGFVTTRYLRRKNAAKYLDLTPSAIDALRRRGLLRGHRLGGRGEYVYAIADLDACAGAGAEPEPAVAPDPDTSPTRPPPGDPDDWSARLGRVARGGSR